MKAIESNTQLTSRSICNYDCIFKLTVIERKGNFATIIYNGKQRRTKIYNDGEVEYLQPDKYSMSPIFRASTAKKAL